MAYDTQLADRIREYLVQFQNLKIEEKKMFRGLAFIINSKMCVNVSGENLMCRFDPALTQDIAEKTGFLPMIMKEKNIKDTAMLSQQGLRTKKILNFG